MLLQFIAQIRRERDVKFKWEKIVGGANRSHKTSPVFSTSGLVSFCSGITGPFVRLPHAHPFKTKGEQPCRFTNRPVRIRRALRLPTWPLIQKSQSRTNLFIRRFARLLVSGCETRALFNAELSYVLLSRRVNTFLYFFKEGKTGRRDRFCYVSGYDE